MLDVLTIAAGLLASLLAVPALVVFVQACLACSARPPAKAAHEGRRRAAAVVMPAHNEAASIAASVKALKEQLTVHDRFVVVADNCTDDTAALAAAAGAEVMVRTDPEHRGKGYALDHGVRGIAEHPREVVVIVDADCTLAPGALDTLVRSCTATKRPAQALYLMHSPAGAGLTSRLGELAWLLRNQVRPMGWHALGLPCQLMGSGMALPYEKLCNMRLATGEIVEDLQLGIDLALAGDPPLFCPQAQVHSVFPLRTQDLVTQRKRWEIGHLGMIGKGFPRLLGEAIRQRKPALLAMALDLCVPPLALLVLMQLFTFAVGIALLILGEPAWVAVVPGFALLLVTMAVILTWHRYGRQILGWSELLAAPAYILVKLPTYGQALLRRRMAWVRTARDATGEIPLKQPDEDRAP